MLSGDDAAGVLAARHLRRRLTGTSDRWLVIDAGLAPESCTGRLRHMRPDLAVLIDAADLGELPGTVRLLDWQQVDALSVSTHTLPLSLVCRYLIAEIGCRVALIGIQAGSTQFGERPARIVREAAAQVAQELAGILTASSA
jgi:hydrogenase 3 maturation protease